MFASFLSRFRWSPSWRSEISRTVNRIWRKVTLFTKSTDTLKSKERTGVSTDARLAHLSVTCVMKHLVSLTVICWLIKNNNAHLRVAAGASWELAKPVRASDATLSPAIFPIWTHGTEPRAEGLPFCPLLPPPPSDHKWRVGVQENKPQLSHGGVSVRAAAAVREPNGKTPNYSRFLRSHKSPVCVLTRRPSVCVRAGASRVHRAA